MKRKYSWTSFRSTNLLIGLIFALSFCLLAFNYTIQRSTDYFAFEVDSVEEDIVEVVRTVHEKKKVKLLPPPEKIEKIDNSAVIQDEVEFISEPDVMHIDVQDSVIENVIVDKPIISTTAPIVSAEPGIPASNDPDDDFILFAETMPYYGDCNDQNLSKEEKKSCSDRALLTYLQKEINYPQLARDNEIEGLVIINILLNKSGQIEKAEIFRDIGGGCGSEALRVIGSMGNWSPAKQRGHPTKILLRLPVEFQLQ